MRDKGGRGTRRVAVLRISIAWRLGGSLLLRDRHPSRLRFTRPTSPHALTRTLKARKAIRLLPQPLCTFLSKSQYLYRRSHPPRRGNAQSRARKSVDFATGTTPGIKLDSRS